jgi:hypothetical protein
VQSPQGSHNYNNNSSLPQLPRPSRAAKELASTRVAVGSEPGEPGEAGEMGRLEWLVQLRRHYGELGREVTARCREHSSRRGATF